MLFMRRAKGVRLKGLIIFSFLAISLLPNFKEMDLSRLEILGFKSF